MPGGIINLALFGFYLGLALTSTAATWGKPDGLRSVGLALLVGFTLSNLAWFQTPPPVNGVYDGMSIALRVSLFTCVEIALALCALGVWLERPGSVMILIVAVCTVSAMMNVWLVMVSSLSDTPGPVWWQINLHEIGTNGCFIIQCVLAIWAGWSSERVSDTVDFEHRRTRDIDLVAQLDAQAHGGASDAGA